MNLQYSLPGILISIIFYAIAFFALRPVFRFLGPHQLARHLRWPIAVIAAMLPFADELWIAANFSHVCAQAGMKIYRKVEVSGFLDETSVSSSRGLRDHLIVNASAINDFEKNGYQFRESSLTDGKVWRLERVPDGLQASIRNHISALYQISRPTSDANTGYQITCSEDVVSSLDTREVLARYRYCKRYAGLLDSLWMRLLHWGPVAYCPTLPEGAEVVLYRQVLLPIRPH